jgi:hypothetical protein
MRKARGAKASIALGATLIAAALPMSAQAGISGGDIQGISGGDVLGISGGDILGISGGDVAGISGGDSQGISGGDVLGISGGDALGISGGDVAGISGGDVLGISGGDVAVISGGDALGISGGDILSGPVEAIDLANGTFHSLGQVVMTSGRELRNLRVGDYVSVEGSVMGPGWLYADVVTVTDIEYVPGATEVFVTGLLSEINSASGTARLGSLTIDYTPSLARAEAPSSAMWSFRGIQPAVTGLMISEISGTFEQ